MLSISWAITPTSLPVLPCIVFLSSLANSFQSNVLPVTPITLHKAFSIGLILHFNLLSEVANATTSFVASILPVVVVNVVVPPTCK